MKPCWKPCYIAFVHSTTDVVGLLVCWDGFWCILPPHLLQQVGLIMHQIDEVKTGWLSNYLWQGNGPVVIRGGRGLHSYKVLVMWLGCWVLGVAFTAVELQHLLQQVGPNLHRFDAVRSSWLLHCISPQSKINPSMIIPDLASKLFIVCGARIAHSRTVLSLHCFVIFTPRHRLWNGCNEAPNNTSNITKSSSKQYRLGSSWVKHDIVVVMTKCV